MHAKSLISRNAIAYCLFAALGCCLTLPTLADGDTAILSVDVIIVDDLVAKPVPLTDFRIILDAPGTGNYTVRTDEKGHFEIKLAAGQYFIESVRPVTLKGRTFSWHKRFIVLAGKDSTLKLSDADSTIGQTTSGRQISDEAHIYTKYKASVVTVESDTGHGSGFIVDSSGLILTNQHVINGSHWFAVRFDRGLRIRATLVNEDAAADAAVLRVHPSLLQNRSVLPLAVSPNSPVCVEGERVLAIGSPLNQQSALTTGIVSKVESDVIISDININHGSSGGPLLNLAGEVIGITTFGDFSRAGGPGISGIVAITKALPVLKNARSMPETPTPDAAPLPDISTVPFPLDALNAAAQKNIKPHVFKAPHNFLTTVQTPLTIASDQAAFERLLAKQSEHRTRKLTIEQQKEAKGLPPHRYWERFAGEKNAPVVGIQITPVLRESSSSFLGALAGATVGVRTHRKMEFHSDFYDMQLFRNDELIEPVRRYRIAYDALFEDYFVTAVDQAHAGMYMYDASAFAPGAKVTLKVRDSGNLKSWETLVIDANTQAKIWQDFAEHRARVATDQK